MDFTAFNQIEQKELNYYGRRIVNEIKFALELTKNNNGKYDSIIFDAVNLFTSFYNNNNNINREEMEKIEEILLPLKDDAKSYNVLFVSHAHIDMNWQWGFDETVNVVLSTFRTMLNFMREYQDFTFSQSQAFVYQIVEKYNPDMLREIKQRIKEGRWEVVASTWVEADKNMPNGESHIRQFLIAKNYLSKLLDISIDSLNIDFEPDTFGHSINQPEILESCGVKYYYHSRGDVEKDLFYWEAPSGKRILVNREPVIYSREWITASDALYAPDFYSNNGVKTMLKLYGVGDHGGGATRVEIENIIDMMSYPIFPNVKFSTYREYFLLLEKNNVQFPVVKGELNPVFTGCYTSQSAQKKANKSGEYKLYQTEMLSSFSKCLVSFKQNNELVNDSWKLLLFNQFHDIITGSNVNASKSFALASAQVRDANCGVVMSSAIQSIVDAIEMADCVFDDDDNNSRSEGGAQGFGTNSGLYFSEKGSGNTRYFVLFNTSSIKDDFNVKLQVWDYHGSIEHLKAYDEKGNCIPLAILKRQDFYWGHFYTEVMVKVNLDAFSYGLIKLDDKNQNISYYVDTYPSIRRLEFAPKYVLENDLVKYEFDEMNLSLKSIFDKKLNGYVICDSCGCFNLIMEEKTSESAWLIGKYLSKEKLLNNISNVEVDGNIFESYIKYKINYGNSSLEVMLKLSNDSNRLQYIVKSNFFEIARDNQIPLLTYSLPLNDEYKYTFDVPFGVIDRKQMALDQCANNFVYAYNDVKGLIFTTDSKYGYRIFDDTINLSIIHNSDFPDEAPEFGTSNFTFTIIPSHFSSNTELFREIEKVNNNILVVPTIPHSGTLPKVNKFFDFTGNVTLSSVKVSEDNEGLIFRFYNSENKDSKLRLNLLKTIKKAFVVDSLENVLYTLKNCDNIVDVLVHNNSIISLKIIL